MHWSSETQKSCDYCHSSCLTYGLSPCKWQHTTDASSMLPFALSQSKIYFYQKFVKPDRILNNRLLHDWCCHKHIYFLLLLDGSLCNLLHNLFIARMCFRYTTLKFYFILTVQFNLCLFYFSKYVPVDLVLYYGKEIIQYIMVKTIQYNTIPWLVNRCCC